MKKKKNRYSRYARLFPWTVAAFLIVYGCVPKTTIESNLAEPEQVSDSLILLTPEMFQEKITKLEIMLMIRDSTLSREEIKARLFTLQIHANNPSPDYVKAVSLADSLSCEEKEPKRRLYYRSWKKVLDAFLTSNTVNDSLASEIAEVYKTGESARFLGRKQTKQIDSLVTLISDTLLVRIKQQDDMIKKLQELDLKMEQQRSKIQ